MVGGREECCVCADMGARTPIAASGNTFPKHPLYIIEMYIDQVGVHPWSHTRNNEEQFELVFKLVIYIFFVMGTFKALWLQLDFSVQLS